MMTGLNNVERLSTRGSSSPSDLELWRDWLASERRAASEHSPPSSLILTDADAISLDDYHEHVMQPVRYALTPIAPSMHERDDSLSSTSSMPSHVEFTERVPFLTIPYNSYSYSTTRSERPPLSPLTEKDENATEPSFWSTVWRPNLSKEKVPKSTSTASQGPTSHRIFFPKRRGSGSSTSSASTSQSKTSTGPKSILSRTSSSCTTSTAMSNTRPSGKRSPPSIKSVKSVKFVDEPTVFHDRSHSSPATFSLPSPPPPPSPSPSPTPSFSSDAFGVFHRLKRSLSKSQLAPPKDTRPVISGPYPLWEAPYLGDRASCRSSRASLRSEQSTSSRLRSFWDRIYIGR